MLDQVKAGNKVKFAAEVVGGRSPWRGSSVFLDSPASPPALTDLQWRRQHAIMHVATPEVS